MSGPGANGKLIELAGIAQKNRPAFEFFLSHLAEAGFGTLHEFMTSPERDRTALTIETFLSRGLDEDCPLFDGLGRHYAPRKGAWLLAGWIFRDSPMQRLRPLRGNCQPEDGLSADTILLNSSRESAGKALPDPEFWTWPAIMASMLNNLEGSRRALKGYAVEDIIRATLASSIEEMKLPLETSEKAVLVGNESYDIEVTGAGGRIFLSVKTRETGGGGHSHIFSRDISAAARKARKNGDHCIPVIVSKHWNADLAHTDCPDVIHVPLEPDDKEAIIEQLRAEFAARKSVFQKISGQAKQN